MYCKEFISKIISSNIVNSSTRLGGKSEVRSKKSEDEVERGRSKLKAKSKKLLLLVLILSMRGYSNLPAIFQYRTGRAMW